MPAPSTSCSPTTLLRRLWAPGDALAQRMLDDHRGQIGLALMAIGPFATALWAWDWAHDPAGAAHTLGLRLLFLLLVPTGALVLALRRPLPMGLLLQATLLWTVALYSLILARLHGGMQYGTGAYAVFYVFALFVFGGLSLVWPLLFAFIMPALPHAMALAGWLPDFPHLSFALLMWPMSGCMLLLYLLGAHGDLRRLDLEQRLEEASHTDPLTGVSNRRYLMPRIEDEIGRARRMGQALSVLMVDIDHFKRINDAFGHAIGDEAILGLARVCSHDRRSFDVVARMGGEEFALLLPGLSLDDGLVLGERIRAQAEAFTYETTHGSVLRFTVSVGVSSLRAGDDVCSLLARADAAMYESKARGRNRVSATVVRVLQSPERASRSLCQ